MGHCMVGRCMCDVVCEFGVMLLTSDRSRDCDNFHTPPGIATSLLLPAEVSPHRTTLIDRIICVMDAPASILVVRVCRL
jgi:hypothetical protein